MSRSSSSPCTESTALACTATSCWARCCQHPLHLVSRRPHPWPQAVWQVAGCLQKWLSVHHHTPGAETAQTMPAAGSHCAAGSVNSISWHQQARKGGQNQGVVSFTSSRGCPGSRGAGSTGMLKEVLRACCLAPATGCSGSQPARVSCRSLRSRPASATLRADEGAVSCGSEGSMVRLWG